MSSVVRRTDISAVFIIIFLPYELILAKDKKATTAIKQEEESNTDRDILFLLYFDDLFRASMNALLPRSSLLLRPMPCQRLLAGARQRQQQQVVAAATTRSKHSSTQIKRLFRKHPARQRVEERLGINRLGDPPPSITFEAVCQPEILSNGWSAPPSADLPLPAYPFSVTRTKNKPKDAVGFLPVYSKMRKDGTLTVTLIKKIEGDREQFMKELRAVLQITTPKNPKEDVIRERTGGAIEVRGNHVRQVREWLAGLGF